MRRLTIILAVFLVLAQGVKADENPIEVGSVHWGRDLEKAMKLSGETGKPVFVLFQEVPGCSGCQDFGRTVLTNPLIVEAVEDEFLPVLVYNNRGGEDRQLLERFGEPAWNYQVVRFLNTEGRDIIPRKDRVWTVSGLATRMLEALEATHRQVPKYIHALAQESGFGKSDRIKTPEGGEAIFAVPGLTKLQKAKIEAFLSVDKSKALEWLSPRQRKALMNAAQKAEAGMSKSGR